MSRLIDGDVDLRRSFQRVAAAWRAAVPGCVAVAVTVHNEHGGEVLTLTDHGPDHRSDHGPDRVRDDAQGDVVSALSMSFVGAGGLAAVVRLDASTTRTFDPLLAVLGPLLAGGVGPAVLVRRRLVTDAVTDAATDAAADPAAADVLAGEAVRNQAIGVLLHRHGGTVEQASYRLRALAGTEGRAVADVATDLVAGVRPPVPTVGPPSIPNSDIAGSYGVSD